MKETKQSKKEAATKYDHGKPRYDLIPYEAIDALAEVYTIGATKYADDNWRGGMSWMRVFRALLSHAWKWARGQKRDPDGQLHLASVMWCAATLIWYEEYGVGEDNRWINGKTKKNTR